MTFSVVPLTEENAASAAACEAACLDTAWTETMLRAAVGDPGALYLTALAGDVVIGTAGAVLNPFEGQVANIAVLPAYRRLGVASALLDALVRDISARGMNEIVLETAEDNLPALALYRKFGFVPVGRRKHLYGEKDGIVMRSKK